MKMKRLLVLLLVACMLLPVTQLLAEEEGTTLRVVWFNDANESDVFLDTIQPYLDEHPELQVDMQVIAFSEYEQKLKVMLTGDLAPDIVRLTTNQLPVFLDSLEPINGYVDDIATVEEAFMPASLAFATTEAGEYVAYPTEATANGMIVNKTAFDNAEIDVAEVAKDWTWDEWEECVKQVTAVEGNPSYGLAVDFTPNRFSTLIYEFGGRMMNEGLDTVEFSNPKTVETIEWFKRMHDEEIIPESVWLGSENPAELFQAGVVACHIGGSWNINAYKQNIQDFEWIAVPTPKGEINSSVPGGQVRRQFQAKPSQG